MEMNALQKEFENLLSKKKKIINLSVADYSFFPSLLNHKKIVKSFSQIFKYPYYQPVSKGDPDARESLSKFYKKKGIDISAENILLTSGSSESYLYLFKIFSEKKGEILFPTPSYPLFEEIAKLIHFKLKYYRLNPAEAWQPDLKDIEKKINKNTRAIVLVSPNNPTGSVISEKNLQKILEIAKKHHLAIISDEVFSEFIFGDKAYCPLAKLAQQNYPQQLIFTLNGLSKGFALPGMKLSWITVHGQKAKAKDYIERLEYLADTFLTTNQISQLLTPSLLKYSKKWLKKFQKRVEKNRNMTVEILSQCSELDFTYPQGGFYMFPSVNNVKNYPDLTDEQFVLKLLKEKHLYVQPGYYYDYPENRHFVICFMQNPKTLKKGLKKIVSFLKEL